MTSYRKLSSKYLAAHKKRTRLSILSITLSVALVVGIFSMLDVLLDFEKIQIMHDYGNYHLLIEDAAEEEADAISARVDVENTGTWTSFKSGSIQGETCMIVSVTEQFAPNMGMNLQSGLFPQADNELMLEAWAAESLGLKIGDSLPFAFQDGIKKTFVLTGIFADYGGTKAEGEPGVVISEAAAEAADVEKKSLFLILFQEKADIRAAERQMQDTLGIAEERIGRNDRLLAVLGQSDHNAALQIYEVGGILFLIVLVAGIVMIYNTFHISVMERVRQFGLLRCIGASKAQIRRLVKQEAFSLLVRALPPGILLGMLVTIFCSALLKYFNSYLFAEIPLFTLSPIGILTGAAVGVLTVAIAALLPAERAAKVSPVCAVTGSGEIRVKKAEKRGLLMKRFPVDVAMGIGNAVIRNKTLILMSSSIAIGIILFLGFQVFVDFMHTGLKTTKPYTPDITLTSEAGLGSDLYQELSGLDGAEYVYGRMFGYADAVFDADRLTEEYRAEAGGVEETENGLFVAPDASWIISYDENQLRWAKEDLLEGTLSAEKMNAENGIVAVWQNSRNNVSMRTASLQLGDTVYLDTVAGTKEYTVIAVLRSVPFSDSKRNLTTFITTERQFTEITGSDTMQAIDIQLKKENQEETIDRIKALIGDEVKFLDARQQNSETNQTFLTMAIFIYGFVAVIAMISIVNLVSTMHTSVASKTKYLGILRAVGMSGRQMNRMVIAESAAYCAAGCLSGCVLGVLLRKWLTISVLTAIRIVWAFPLTEVVCVVAAAVLITFLSVLGPLKKIRSMDISETIGSLQ